MPEPKLIEYGSRDEWLNARKIVITSTDIGQIVGVSKWGDRVKVYADKTGAAPDDEDNDRMTIGRHVQSGIASAYAVIRQRSEGGPGLIIDHVPNYALYFNALSPTHAASMDCWQIERSTGDKSPLEIKSTGGYPDEPYDEWITQVQWQMYVTDTAKATIAALCGGDTLKWWDIDRDNDLIVPLATAADAFIEQFVIPENPPMPADPTHSRKALRQIYRESDGTEVSMDMEDLDHVVHLQALKEQAKGVEQQIHDHESHLMHKMGKAEVAYLPNGQKITWKTQTRKAYNVPAGTSRRFLIGKAPDE